MVCGEAILPFRRNAAGSCLVLKTLLMCSCIVFVVGAKNLYVAIQTVSLYPIFFSVLWTGYGTKATP